MDQCWISLNWVTKKASTTNPQKNFTDQDNAPAQNYEVDVARLRELEFKLD